MQKLMKDKIDVYFSRDVVPTFDVVSESAPLY